MKLTRCVSCRSSAYTVMAVEPAAPCGPRVTWSTRFEKPPACTIRKAALLTTPCRELHAWRLNSEPDSTSQAENGTVIRPCPFSATWSGMADNHGGSFTGRTSTRKAVETLSPPVSKTTTSTDPVPDRLRGGKTDSQRL